MLSLQKASLAATGAVALLFTPGIGSARPVSFLAKDGVKVFGELNLSKGRWRGTIVLFHMAGSNRAEYEPLAPILNADGFTTLAVDQRSGASLWGVANQTADTAKRRYDFAGTIPDLDAAIAYADDQQAGPVAIWGSSYSAALVFVVAAKHPEVKALLAFSPGEYIEGYSIESEARKLSIPVFVTSAADFSEIAAATVFADAVPSHRGIQYIPRNGVHGSSTLRVDADPAGADDNWKHVKEFLDKVLPKG
ncbi:MAG: alpha/beta hydrolase [Rhizobium sp.]|nr:MAG: alpha/beta hydrolase [Rhizobium sp.]